MIRGFIWFRGSGFRVQRFDGLGCWVLGFGLLWAKIRKGLQHALAPYFQGLGMKCHGMGHLVHPGPRNQHCCFFPGMPGDSLLKNAGPPSRRDIPSDQHTFPYCVVGLTGGKDFWNRALLEKNRFPVI